ncbi:SnoaL-like domain-containing protein [Aphelenchoides fujianensis]|nr:SnoaL-like domain-containing protein [Aphelenchoides fujianensis]
MGLSKAEVEKIVAQLDREQEEAFKSKDLGAVLRLYHPQAVIVHKNHSVSYGEEQIRKHLEPFMHFDAPFKTTPTYAQATEDGAYLIRRLSYTVGDNPRKFAIEQIYKKVDGRYLIFHDEYEFEQ